MAIPPGGLSAAQAQAHIERIYQDKWSAAKASPDLANSLNLLIYNALHGDLVYEFIQNADDAQADAIQFNLQGNLLTISHNGRHFSAEDIEKICRIAQQEFRDKIDNPGMIGQKGIGIKTAFFDASKMLVYSHPYCFCFQKDHVDWASATRERPFPWQITPIWTDPPPDLELKKVYFILTVNNYQTVSSQIETISANPSLFLFLNQIRRITLLGREFQIQGCRNEAPFGERRIFSAGQHHSSWYYFSGSLDNIPQDVRNELTAMHHHSCPDKYKKPDYKIKLSFAFPFDNRGLIRAVNTVVSCYLPTAQRCEFPFLVNSDFLLDTSRQRLTINKWNQLIFTSIATHHFACLSQMAQNPALRQGIFNALAPSELRGVDPVFAEAYRASFDQAAHTYRFIPSQHDPLQLLTLIDCSLDQTGFVREFYQPLANMDASLLSFADDGLDNVAQRIAPNLNFRDLFKKCSEYLKYKPELSIPFLNFFRTNWARVPSDQQFAFRFELMIPDGFEGNSASPIQNFFLMNQQSLRYPPCLNIPCLPMIAPLGTWLHESIGLKHLSPREIIHGPLYYFVNQGKVVGRQQTIPILRFLHTALRMQLITLHDLKYSIPLLNQNEQMVTTSSCYLPDCLGPAFPLQQLLPSSSIFIHTDYFQEGDDLGIWKNLFLHLGVRQQIVFQHLPNPKISELQQNVHDLDPYLREIYESADSPLKRISTHANHNASHTLVDFVYVPFMNLLPFKAYADQFWDQILRNWKSIDRYCRAPKYKLSNDTRTLPFSYLQYVVREMHTVRTTSGETFQGKKIYAPYFQELVGEFCPVVDAPQTMLPEQAEFFGFKLAIEPLDCLHIFDQMRLKSRKLDSKKYATLLEYIISGFEKLSPIDQKTFNQKEKWMIAEDGSWQRCTPRLMCLLFPEANERIDRSNRVKIVLSHDQMEQCAQIMGFHIIPPEVAPLPEGTEDTTILLDLRKKLPLIALWEAQTTGKEPLEVLKTLADVLRPLKIVHCKEEIRLVNNSDDTTDSLLHEQTLYFHGLGRSIQRKTKISKKLSEFLGLSPSSRKLLPDIWGLKDTGIAGKSQGIYDFINKKRLSAELYHSLNSVFSYHDCIIRGIDAPNQEIEIQAFLSIEKEEIPIQKTTGQGVEILPALLVRKEDSPAPAVLPPVRLNPSPDALTALTKATVPPSLGDKTTPQPAKQLPPFQPKVQFTTFDFSTVRYQTAPAVEEQVPAPLPGTPPVTGTATHPTKPPKQKKTYEETKELGRFGEEFIFHSLIHRFKTKFTFIKSDPILNGVRLSCLDQKNTPLTVQIVWLNRTVEQTEPRDIDLTWMRGDRIVKQRWIEVKTSLSTQVHFFLSKNEWRFMDTHSTDYRLYHVADAESTPTITKFKTLIGRGLFPRDRIEFDKK